MEFVIVEAVNGLGERVYQVRDEKGVSTWCNRYDLPEKLNEAVWWSRDDAESILNRIVKYYKEQARRRIGPDVVVVKRVTVGG